MRALILRMIDEMSLTSFLLQLSASLFCGIDGHGQKKLLRLKAGRPPLVGLR
jgi:hypothetical protein